MFGSEVLDAAAIGAGAALLGGIIAGVFSLLTIRMNHKAERSKIAFEKQIDAFSHIVEAITAIENQRYNILGAYTTMQQMVDNDNPNSRDYTLSRLVDKANDIISSIGALYTLCEKHSIYLPITIQKEITKYGGVLFLKEDITKDNVIEYIQNQCDKPPSSRVVPLMRDLVGL